MPHFDEFGGDCWICQVCGKVQSSKVKSAWRSDITGNQSAGNVCPTCLDAHGKGTLNETFRFKVLVKGQEPIFTTTFKDAATKAKSAGQSAMIKRI